MNREILFRGKRVGNGEWVYGVPIQSYDGDWQICTDSYKCTVIPETIGQFTGLTDKNGTKIFEGDILNFFDNDGEYTNYEIVWFGNKWAVVMCGTNIADDLDMFFCEYSDIIGNIHDNAELLEVGE